MAVNNNEEKHQNKPIIGDIPYNGITHQTLLSSEALYELKELREMIDNHPRNVMATPADEGQLISMLVKLINAKNTMDYSLLSTALALPSDGKVLALDISREYYELGLPMIEKAGVAHKIDFRQGPALLLLDQLLQNENNKGTFDFVYVDADKDNYLNYHKKVIDLVKVGGLIGYDNTLWVGSVALPSDAPMPEFIRGLRGHVIEVNKYLAQYSRIEICQLAVGDGITLCSHIS